MQIKQFDFSEATKFSIYNELLVLKQNKAESK